MNKTAIKNFAVWARRKLIADITYKAGLIGISEKGIAEPLSQSTKDMQFFDIGTKNYAEVSGGEIAQRNALVAAMKAKERDTDYKTAFQNVVEEIAYTWFNRMIAVRFMEVNDYLPSRIRVLSSENSAKLEPDFVTTPFDTDLSFTPYEQDRVLQLKDENKLDELFRLLFIKQCNKLGEILPELFEKTSDYTELLLTISFTDKDGVVYHLTHDIAEDDFNVSKEGQVEIIGWMYQYYNTEPKDEVFALLKKNVKITKERIPAATQLFTPDWIVRYMVENSLGRLWIEHSRAQGGNISDEYMNGSYFGWKYYLDEAKQEPDVEVQLAKIREDYKTIKLEDIKVIDPCMGSGHILVYAFDVLMQIYTSQGYIERDAAKSIVEHNLYGLDIDKRAYQLAYFAVMMKARQYNRRILNGETDCHLYFIKESNSVNRNLFSHFGDNLSQNERAQAIVELNKLLDVFIDANEYGSIINVPDLNWGLLYNFVGNFSINWQLSFEAYELDETARLLRALVELGAVMAQKYDVVVTNPPYMGSSGMSAKLSDYVKKNYPDSKSDLFAVFMEKCGQITKKNCYQAMITQHAWMFLSSFEKLRDKLLQKDTVNMAHLGARAFEEIGGEVVQTTSFVLRSSHINNSKGVYCRLVEPTTQKGKEDMFLAGENRFESAQDNFSKIPGSPIAYWVSDKVFNVYKNKNLDEVAKPRHGLATSDNDRFLKMWYEVNINKTSLIDRCDYTKKWFPMNKGGSFRKWYGNLEWIINYENDGKEIKDFATSIYKCSSRTIQNTQFYFKKAITWSALTSGTFSVRWSDSGALFGSGGYCAFTDDNIEKYITGLMNNKVSSLFLELVSPTLNYEVGHIKSIPVIISEDKKPQIDIIVQEDIDTCKLDWDAFETSWDFKKHPLI